MRALTALAVYAVAGPLVGALIVFAAAMIVMFYGPEGMPSFRDSSLEEFGRGVTLLAGLAYLVGGLQALFVAIVAAATQALHWPGRAAFLAVMIAGFMTGIGFVSWMVSNSNTPFLSIQSFIFLGVHIGAAVGCWLITQGILRLFGEALRPESN
jgi:hypothetical protein